MKIIQIANDGDGSVIGLGDDGCVYRLHSGGINDRYEHWFKLTQSEEDGKNNPQ